MFGPLGTEEVARGSPEPVEGNDPAWDLLQDLCLHRRRSCAVCADSVCKSHRKKALPKVLGESLCPGRPHVPPPCSLPLRRPHTSSSYLIEETTTEKIPLTDGPVNKSVESLLD